MTVQKEGSDKAFKCKRCKNFYSDSLSEMYKHLEESHSKYDIKYLEKSHQKCSAKYYSSTNTFQPPLPCMYLIGHLGPHKYEIPTFYQSQQVQTNMFNLPQGWRES